ALQLDGGFMILYKRMKLERQEDNFRVQYKQDDYKKLQQYYDQKVQQVHIVGEYAKRMINDYVGALKFVEDYFSLNYSSFLNKYFPGSRQDEIKKTITPKKFQQIFGDLSAAQLAIIKDPSDNTVVLAGPGSGKTRILVHKLASIFLIENIKHEQILALTFSRAAITEFKKRLFGLIGNAAVYIEIKTFHSYSFDLLGKKGDIKSANHAVKDAVEAIKADQIIRYKIGKLILLIDEAQDMNADEYELVLQLREKNEGMRVILVGDDDQNIFEFRGSSSEYLKKFVHQTKAEKFELIENYRSGKNVVSFSNRYASCIPDRMKTYEITSVVAEEGNVSIIRYSSDHLIVPLVEHVCSMPLRGTTCILSRTNEESGLVVGLLKKRNMPVQLIQSNEGFLLSDVFEIRSFMDLIRIDEHTTIPSEVWEKAKREFKNRFQKYLWTPRVMTLLDDFEKTNPKSKYSSDFQSFISESKLEDFIHETSDMIYVSTFHKAKGREFDNVFILLQKGLDSSADFKRSLYVAMTRAKSNLIVHVHGNELNRFISDDVKVTKDDKVYDSPDEITMTLTHEHVQLSYFSSRQEIIRKLRSGEDLKVNPDGCANEANQFVLRWSVKFIEEIKKRVHLGYQLYSAKVNFLVYWSETADKEILIVLPEVTFRKGTKTL
ncbi:MAG: ATP-dependent helicase, partial [Saprospiraceae bacterium]